MRNAIFAIALAAAGCATVPPIDPKAIPAAPQSFKEGDGRWTIAPPAESQPRGEGWRAFGDPVLDDLVARADRGNTDVRVAAARLRQARALLQASEADQSPHVDASASGGRQLGLPFNPVKPATLYAAGVGASYEIDLFGRLAQATRAAELDAAAAEGLLQSARLAVQADVAQAYLAIRALDEERALVRRTVVAYRETLDLIERRYRAGDVAELDVSRSRTEVAATESEALALDRRRAQLEHALAVLVGEVPSSFRLAEAPWSTRLPVIPAGVPSTVLTRRPDVSAAEAQMLAAQARVGVAKAAWFPSISLTASGGYASPQIDDLFRWSARAWGVGALLSLPVFDGGRRAAGVESASGGMDAAVAQYRERVLVAFRDVEDQLSALRLLREQSEAQERAVRSAARTTALSDARYRNGLVSQLELLDAQRSELRNRREAVTVRAAQYQATVGLVRALGGGWGQAS
ncbi:MAG TPA: efflux transporter outer membrane subunit [Usitatibacter sp.]|nr:efflux transporter outer membrane subunit [Usitatibacter sp.]